MKKYKIYMLFFIVIFVSSFLFIQKIFVPVWDYPRMYDHVNKSIKDLQKLPANSISAFFLGTSHAGEEIAPLDIYNNSGISTFNLATSNQPIDASYILLDEVLKRQSPKIIFFEVSSLFRINKELDEGRTYVIDSLPINKNKIRLAFAHGNAKPFKNNIFTNNTIFISTLFPIYKYHIFWKTIDSNCFYKKTAHYSTFGYNMYSYVYPYTLNWTDSNEIEKEKKEREEIKQDIYLYDNNTISKEKIDSSFQSSITNESIKYLQLMNDLCLKNEVNLVLIKNPVVMLPNYYNASWTKTKSDIIKELARQLNLEFIDLLYDYDLGIDWNHDTKDGGMHLNYDGAKKITQFFCDYLYSKGIETSRNPIFELNLKNYNKHTKLAELHLEENFSNYLQKLKNFPDKLCVFMTICDTGMFEMIDKEKENLFQTGLKKFQNAEWSDSYIAILDENNVILDSLSNQAQKFTYLMQNEKKVTIQSNDFLSNPMASVKIKNNEYALNQRGLNIVVYDKDVDMVIDSCVFDFWQSDTHEAIRDKHNSYVFLYDYEKYLIRGK